MRRNAIWLLVVSSVVGVVNGQTTSPSAEELESRLQEAEREGRVDDALKLIDQLADQLSMGRPGPAETMRVYRFMFLEQHDRWDEAKAVARKRLAESKSGFALWQMADQLNLRAPMRRALTEDDVNLGLALVQRAAELEVGDVDYSFPEVWAALLARKGDWAGAVEKQRQAVSLAEKEGGKSAALVPILRKAAELYEQQKLPARMRIVDAIREKKTAEVRRLTAEAVAEEPNDRDRHEVMLIRYELRNGDRSKGVELARQLVERSNEPARLNSLAWALASTEAPSKEEIALGVRASEKSIRLLGPTPIATYFDTLARLKALAGNWQEAVKMEEQAFSRAKASEKSEFERALKSYREGRLPPK